MPLEAKGVRYPGAGDTGNVESPGECWDLNSGPLRERKRSHSSSILTFCHKINKQRGPRAGIEENTNSDVPSSGHCKVNRITSAFITKDCAHVGQSQTTSFLCGLGVGPRILCMLARQVFTFLKLQLLFLLKNEINLLTYWMKLLIILSMQPIHLKLLSLFCARGRQDNMILTSIPPDKCVDHKVTTFYF